MKRFLSMILCLALLLGACALAEGEAYDSTLLTFELSDPVIRDNREVVADLTGLTLRFVVGLSDSGVQGLSVGATVGDDNDEKVIAALHGQLEDGMVYWTADGIESVYGYDLETLFQMLAGEAGAQDVELPFDAEDVIHVAAIPLRSALRDFMVGRSGAETDPGEARMRLIETMVAPYIIESKTDGLESKHIVAISEEQCAAVIEQTVGDLRDRFGDLLGDIEVGDVATRLDATITAAIDSAGAAGSLEIDGVITSRDVKSGETMQTNLNYTDDMSAWELTVSGGDKAAGTDFSMRMGYTPAADGNGGAFAVSMDARMTVTIEDLDPIVSRESIEFTIEKTDEACDIYVEDHSEASGLYDGESLAKLEYHGYPYGTFGGLPEGGMQTGEFTLTYKDDMGISTVSCGVLMSDCSAYIGDWAIDASTALTAKKIGSLGMRMAQTLSLSTVGANAMKVLKAELPELAEAFEGLF